MRVQLIYNSGDIRPRDWNFIPSVGDIIWDENVVFSGKLYRVTERHVTLDSKGKIHKISLMLENTRNS